MSSKVLLFEQCLFRSLAWTGPLYLSCYQVRLKAGNIWGLPYHENHQAAPSQIPKAIQLGSCLASAIMSFPTEETCAPIASVTQQHCKTTYSRCLPTAQAQRLPNQYQKMMLFYAFGEASESRLSQRSSPRPLNGFNTSRKTSGIFVCPCRVPKNCTFHLCVLFQNALPDSIIFHGARGAAWWSARGARVKEWRIPAMPKAVRWTARG
jgi:hypothetical protein